MPVNKLYEKVDLVRNFVPRIYIYIYIYMYWVVEWLGGRQQRELFSGDGSCAKMYVCQRLSLVRGDSVALQLA